MRYQEYRPAAPLSGYVACLWYLETDGSSQPVQRVVPDGSVEIVLHAGNPFSQLHNGAAVRQSSALFCGQITQPVFLVPSARGRVFGIRFLPAGAGAFFREPMCELRDQLVPLADLSGRLHTALSASIEEGDHRHTFARLAAVLQAQLPESASSRALEHCVARIRQSQGNAQISHLARECATSQRQLQRLFRQHVGIGVKMLCRLTRFQKVLRRLDDSSANWADVALDAGYYDQSHLLRDFRRFAGETPTFLLSPKTDLAEHFTSRRKVSYFSKT